MRHLARQIGTSGPLAAVDPRIRMMAAFTLLALVVSSSTASFPVLVALICLPATLVHGMRLRTLLLRLAHPLFICLVIIFLKALTGTGVEVHIAWLPPLHVDGLRVGLLISARIAGAVSVAILLGHVMTFTEAMAALAWLRVPRTLVEVSLFAWRSLFMLYDDASVVYTAQKNRLGYCGLLRGLRSFGSMAGMLVIKAFDGSHAMTVAMTQRGYDGSLPLLRGSRPSTPQLAGLACFALIAAIAWRVQN